MIQVLLVVQVLLAAALIGMVLIQRSETDGFGLGSGGGNNFMSGRATANLLTRTTAILAALFMLNSLGLSILASHGRHTSIADTVIEQESAVPSVPLATDTAEPKAAAPMVKAKKVPAPGATTDMPEVPDAN